MATAGNPTVVSVRAFRATWTRGQARCVWVMCSTSDPLGLTQSSHSGARLGNGSSSAVRSVGRMRACMSGGRLAHRAVFRGDGLHRYRLGLRRGLLARDMRSHARGHWRHGLEDGMRGGYNLKGVVCSRPAAQAGSFGTARSRLFRDVRNVTRLRLGVPFVRTL